MPATRHRFSKCQHKGFGSTGCHRCEQADKLEALATSLKAAKAAPKEGKQVIGQDEATKALNEAERLRSSTKKNND